MPREKKEKFPNIEAEFEDEKEKRIQELENKVEKLERLFNRAIEVISWTTKIDKKSIFEI